MKKRVVACILAVACIASLNGCGSKFNGQDTVVEVGDEKVTADVANFFARYQQAQFETTYSSYLGDNFWGKEVTDGKTYEENYKDSIMDSLEEMYVLDEHKDDYKVSLSDDEEKSIEDAAKKFTDSNDSAAKDTVSGDEKTVKKVLELLTLQKKMETAMTADVDTNVSDEEAAQRTFSYMKISLTTYTDESGKQQTYSADETTVVKKNADDAAQKAQSDFEDFQKDAASAEDFSVFATAVGASATDLTFDSDTTSPNEDLIKAADKLKEGEVTDVIEADNGYYVAKVVSLLDRDATDTKKESIVSQRKSDQYQSICKKWKKKTDIKVHKKVWNTISFADQGVTVKSTTEDTDTSSDSSSK